MTIGLIIEAIRAKRVRVTDHADEEATADGLAIHDVLASTERGEIIKQYPDDKPYPSCLVYGQTDDGAPVHSVWAYNDETRWAVLITTYRPDPDLWVDWRVRRMNP